MLYCTQTRTTKNQQTQLLWDQQSHKAKSSNELPNIKLRIKIINYTMYSEFLISMSLATCLALILLTQGYSAQSQKILIAMTAIMSTSFVAFAFTYNLVAASIILKFKNYNRNRMERKQNIDANFLEEFYDKFKNKLIAKITFMLLIRIALSIVSCCVLITNDSSKTVASSIDPVQAGIAKTYKFLNSLCGRLFAIPNMGGILTVFTCAMILLYTYHKVKSYTPAPRNENTPAPSNNSTNLACTEGAKSETSPPTEHNINIEESIDSNTNDKLECNEFADTIAVMLDEELKMQNGIQSEHSNSASDVNIQFTQTTNDLDCEEEPGGDMIQQQYCTAITTCNAEQIEMRTYSTKPYQ